MRELYQLTDEDTGDFRIDTSSGTSYMLDLNRPARTLMRLPQQNKPSGKFFGLPVQAALRRDGDTLPLLRIERAEVGERASFWILVWTDAVVTWRGTTPVIRIVELQGPVGS